MAQHVTEFGRDGRPTEPDGRLDAPAFHRNHQPIWAVLQKFLAGKTGDVLEAGSGTGQHVVHFARQSPDIIWWPSDFSDAHLKSIAAWRAAAAYQHPPAAADRPLRSRLDPARATAAPRKIARGVLRQCHPHRAMARRGRPVAGAARHLRDDGRLFLYGPFKRDGRHTAVSNAVFDTSLRSQNPDWGVRDVGDVAKLADRAGLAWPKHLRCPPTI